MSSGFSGNYGYSLPADWAYDQIVTITVGSGDAGLEIDNDIASGRDTGQASFDPPRAMVPDTLLNASIITSMMTDVGKYMESIGFPLDGGLKKFQHWKCFESTVVDHDSVITELSNRYGMRKALIQTSAYWEMRHIGVEDDGKDALTIATYHTTGEFLESSTGIGQCQGKTALGAWNYCINKGYASGTILNPDSDDDLYSIWNRVYDSEEFDLRTVCMVHLWDADGKLGGDHEETPLRSMRLDYTETEVFEVIRRYQGWNPPTVEDAKLRMAIYQIMEKYNAISRNP
jgi:hypothetical protein